MLGCSARYCREYVLTRIGCSNLRDTGLLSLRMQREALYRQVAGGIHVPAARQSCGAESVDEVDCATGIRLELVGQHRPRFLHLLVQRNLEDNDGIAARTQA